MPRCRGSRGLFKRFCHPGQHRPRLNTLSIRIVTQPSAEKEKFAIAEVRSSITVLQMIVPRLRHAHNSSEHRPKVTEDATERAEGGCERKFDNGTS